MAMRPAPAKYLFDEDFAASGRGKPAITLADHAAQLKEAETAAYASGFAQAQAEAKADAAQRSAAALERIAAALAALDRSLAGVEASLETEAIEVAATVGRKPAPPVRWRGRVVEGR